jgi:hypothetical protein
VWINGIVVASFVKRVDNDKLIKKSVKAKSSEIAKSVPAKLSENTKKAAEKGVQAVQSTSKTNVQNTSIDAPKIAAGQNDENIGEDCMDHLFSLSHLKQICKTLP